MTAGPRVGPSCDGGTEERFLRHAPPPPAPRSPGLTEVGISVALRHHVLLILLLSTPAAASGQPERPLPVLDVPFVSQSQALCGGAAAAMVLRYWGERGLAAESFAHLVDHSAAGIRTDALIGELRGRGWQATGLRGASDLVARELERNRPVIALVEDRPGTFHYVVIVAAHARAVVFHDPARAPFRVMTTGEFERRWRAAGYWMAVVVPGADANDGREASRHVTVPGIPAASPCHALIDEGVRLAQAGDEAAAERALVSALPCGGSAALRELAGVRFLQRRWPDAAALAAAAVTEDAGDAHAWRLLATSRFLQEDRSGALAAWNAVAEPRIDLVRVDGLTRTRQRVVERLLGVQPEALLTPAGLVRARRRLAELPSALSSQLTYVPVPGGLTEVRAAVVERPIVPSDVWGYAAIGLGAAARREVQFTTGSISGGGEQIGVAWRFWAGRPRVAVHAASASPWGGLWRVDAFTETQPFDTPVVDPAERRAVRLTGSQWATSHLRWTLSAGMDRWERSGTFGVFGAALRYATPGDRLMADLALDRWSGAAPFARVHGIVSLRSLPMRLGPAWHASAGAGRTSAHAPADTWFGGDTGHARPVLLRAHPLLDGGRLQLARLGRAVTHASAEGRYWWQGPVATRLGVGAFIDAVRVDRRFDTGARGDVDVGVGARLSVPGVSGVFRLDAARGLRDGATAVSFAYEP